jgi:hypothetical protein
MTFTDKEKKLLIKGLKTLKQQDDLILEVLKMDKKQDKKAALVMAESKPRLTDRLRKLLIVNKKKGGEMN